MRNSPDHFEDDISIWMEEETQKVIDESKNEIWLIEMEDKINKEIDILIKDLKESIEKDPTQEYFHIKKFINDSAKYLDKIYEWGGSSSKQKWLDCSGFIGLMFQDLGINYHGQRPTASKFYEWSDKVEQKDVRPWDFMFWHNKDWKKHSPIYHIELVMTMPYQENWKRYVNTIWSSTDSGSSDSEELTNKNKQKKWVAYRKREITSNRSFWRTRDFSALADNYNPETQTVKADSTMYANGRFEPIRQIPIKASKKRTK